MNLPESPDNPDPEEGPGQGKQIPEPASDGSDLPHPPGQTQSRIQGRAAAATGVFATAAVRDWIEAQWGVAYTVAGVYTLLERLRIRLKGPRPRHTKADPQAREIWKKGGSGNA